MIALTNAQLRIVMSAGSSMPPEKRSVYLERIAAMLAHRGRGHFDDAIVSEAVALALSGMIHLPAA